MTAVELALLLIGVVFLLGSFFIVEKLSPSDISRVAELSEDELRIVMDRELGAASAKVSDLVDNAVDLSMNQIQRTMEKNTNEKIMAISEYSDSVMENLKKMNNEVTFLYSMLGDKHTEINESMMQLNELMQEYRELQQQFTSFKTVLHANADELKATVDDGQNGAEEETSDMQQALAGMNAMGEMELSDSEDHARTKEDILERYRLGDGLKDIARDLGLGYGEVKLIVELYKGETEQ